MVINGRFYGQPVTGVQRYGREIVAALDGVLASRRSTAELAVPSGVVTPPMRSILPIRLGVGRGHGWEQAVLPLRRGSRLLNLCNTGPLLKRRQVLCIHDTNVFAQPDAYRLGFRVAYRALQPLMARRAAAVTTVSQASARAISERFGLDRRRIAVLPNGHEHVFAWKPGSSRLKLLLSNRRPFVLLLGSRARHKNMTLLLDLAPSLDGLGLDLLIAGGAAPIFAKGLGASDPRAAPSRNIHWLGKVSDDDLALLFSQALCLAFPSFTEGFGLPIVEAMALGCPVVASNRASMPEVCGRAALLGSPDDPAGWLKHIEALVASPTLREDLRGRGAAQALRFSWEASARGYLELLEGLQ